MIDEKYTPVYLQRAFESGAGGGGEIHLRPIYISSKKLTCLSAKQCLPATVAVT